MQLTSINSNFVCFLIYFFKILNVILLNNYVADDVDTCILRCAYVDIVYGRLAMLCDFVCVGFGLIARLSISNSN